ncbi:hypothetical protein GU3_07950 [Oceanimonas sp. GK1]|uniref:hypothetical protein n=1 Tax=Oceanimonas sp. (strain GK1 / IBRC-M 10197) TaxID=511062 RepID=UPI00024950CD|nr:hypothetical protein [Oceanimonas sp. GK1]AEY01346.1 hypothetical protein GU3_07950 [Oceanimonas sp. GK1]
MHNILNCGPESFKIEFEIEGEDFDPCRKSALVFLITTPLGSHKIGMIFILTGFVEKIEKEVFKLNPDNVIIERKIASTRDEEMNSKTLEDVIEDIKETYRDEYSIISMIEKTS